MFIEQTVDVPLKMVFVPNCLLLPWFYFLRKVKQPKYCKSKSGHQCGNLVHREGSHIRLYCLSFVACSVSASCSSCSCYLLTADCCCAVSRQWWRRWTGWGWSSTSPTPPGRRPAPCSSSPRRPSSSATRPPTSSVDITATCRTGCCTNWSEELRHVGRFKHLIVVSMKKAGLTIIMAIKYLLKGNFYFIFLLSWSHWWCDWK